jgi:hypothetical protein
MTILLRRRKLGSTSCREVSRFINTLGSPITVIRNDRQVPAGHDTLIRWGCTSEVPIRNVLNTTAAIHQVNDKLGFRRILNEANLCPKTWFSVQNFQDWVMEGPGTMPPVVVRPNRHAQGRRLHVCRTTAELAAACARYPQYYISLLINKVAEYRVFVVSGRAVAVAKKTPGNPQDVAWNVARGGRFDNVDWGDWPLKAVKTSIEAFNLSTLDFGGVDVMVDGEGNCYVLEINSAPSLTSPYRQECMAKGLHYALTRGKDRIPLVQDRGGYRKFIHPAVCDNAQLVVA